MAPVSLTPKQPLSLAGVSLYLDFAAPFDVLPDRLPFVLGLELDGLGRIDDGRSVANRDLEEAQFAKPLGEHLYWSVT